MGQGRRKTNIFRIDIQPYKQLFFELSPLMRIQNIELLCVLCVSLR